MKVIRKGCVGLAFALGAGLAMAQAVERDGKAVNKPTPILAQASSKAPVQTAQATGGAATGASTTGAAAAGTVGLGAVVAVGVAIGVIAVATDSTETTTHH